jgi:urease accessory protein
MQRAAGTGCLAVKNAGGRPKLARLYQEGAAKIRMPRPAAGPLEAVLINTAGGMTGGDRLAWKIEVAAGASAAVTTQACEKIYRSAGGAAEIACTLQVGDGGRLAWLPQETILFDGSAATRRIDIALSGDAEALILEAAIFGRQAMGETVGNAIFRDRWRVRRDGRMVHAEEFAIGPDVAATLARSAVAGGAIAVATLLLLAGDAADYVERAREIVGDDGGVSAWPVAGSGKLLARLVARDGYSLRKRLVPLVELLNGQAGLPKIWSI